MKHDLALLKTALATAPTKAVNAKLFRLVAFKNVVAHNPPNWLYTSGKPNRYNPAGVDCVYFSETREVAQAEYDRMWQGISGESQPFVTFCAEISLQRVLDLTDAATLKKLKLAKSSLFKAWRTVKKPTVTQLIGKAVSDTGIFSSIRYPSAATASNRRAGANFVIFRGCVHSPDHVRILGPDDTVPLDEWT